MTRYDIFLLANEKAVAYDVTGKLVRLNEPTYLGKDFLTGRLRADQDGVERLTNRRYAERGQRVLPITIEVPDGSVFVVKHNSDLNEGRGSNIVMARFDNLPAAIEAAENQGVQGASDGDIYLAGDASALSVFSTTQQWRESQSNRTDVQDVHLYSSYGGLNSAYVVTSQDQDLTNDPEYQKYLQLQEKFAKVVH